MMIEIVDNFIWKLHCLFILCLMGPVQGIWMNIYNLKWAANHKLEEKCIKKSIGNVEKQILDAWL